MRAGQDIATEALATSFAELSERERTQLMHLLAKSAPASANATRSPAR